MGEKEQFEGWASQIEAIQDETVQLFWSRKLFRAVRRMFETNEQLAESGHHVRQWLSAMFARDAAMLVRRELDKQHGVVNLRHLLHDIEKNAHVLRTQSAADGLPTAEEVRRDREELEQATAKVRDYAERLLAHRTSATSILVTWDDLDSAIKAVLRTMRRYRGLLTNTDLLQATPVPTFDWLAPFAIPWASETFRQLPEDDDEEEQ